MPSCSVRCRSSRSGPRAVGIAAGLIAVASALWADRSPDLSGPRADRSDTALAIGTGILGIVIGVGFVAMVLPYW